jgi:hypothetical protein
MLGLWSEQDLNVVRRRGPGLMHGAFMDREPRGEHCFEARRANDYHFAMVFPKRDGILHLGV